MRLSMEELDRRVELPFAMPLPAMMAVANHHQQQQLALVPSTTYSHQQKPQPQALTAMEQYRLDHLNDGYALRKKRAKRATLSELQAAVQDLESLQRSLKRQQRQLQNALANARYVVAVHNNPSGQEQNNNLQQHWWV